MSERRPLRSLLLTAGTVLCVLTLIILVQLRPPAWWVPSRLADDALERTGERFERGCVSEIYRVRPDTAPWAIRIREDDVNAWLAARLPRWCEHVGVERLGDVQVRFTDDAVDVAIDVPALPTVAVATFRPTVAGPRLQPTLGTLHMGRLPMPFLTAGPVRDAIDAFGTSDGDLRAILLPLMRGDSVETTFELADHRRVRLRDVEVRTGELLMEFETLPAAARPDK